MPQTQVPGFLYDSRGNPVLPGAGNLHRRTEADDRLRPTPRSHYNDYSALLSPRRFPELVTESRKLAATGQPSALLDQKADYVAASHFRPQFKGTDADYGTAALPILESALQIVNLRGYLYDWKTSWRLCVPSLATDGRIWVLLTRWPDTGWPALQFLEAHRIGQRESCTGIVGKDEAFTTITDENGTTKQIRGAYRGLRISKGIITNTAGTEVAYRVLGAAPDGSEDQDISARDLYPVGRPRSFSEDRTPPEIAAAALDFIGLDLAWQSQLDQQIIDARLTLIETTATGKPDPAQLLTGMRNGTPAGTPTTIDERGMTRIIKSGMELKPHESARPSDQWMNFEERGSSRGAAAMRWRAEMLNPTRLSGAANRAFQDQINTLIQETFSTIDKAATRALNYISAVLSGPPLGVLPVHPESMKWGIATPPWFEVDRASAKYDLDDVAAGRTSMRTLRARDGKTSIEVYQERALDYLEAKKVSDATGVPIDILRGDEGATVQRTGAPQQDQAGSQETKKAA